MPYKNKEDQLACQRRHYKRNVQDYVDRNKQRRKRLREFIRSLKTTISCKICNENEPICIDFHHLDPSKKEYNVSEMAHRGFSEKRILEEISQCVPLCANCHRKVHEGIIEL